MSFTVGKRTKVKHAKKLLFDYVSAKKSNHADCPLCEQLVKVYRRKVTSSMARMLIKMYRFDGKNFIYLPDLRSGNDSRDDAMMQYWGLIEEEKIRRPDGGRAGYWKVTDAGEEWLKGSTTIPCYALVYNGKCLGFEGKDATIKDALGKNFNLEDLMNGI